jgi:membrane dipeptidase
MQKLLLILAIIVIAIPTYFFFKLPSDVDQFLNKDLAMEKSIALNSDFHSQLFVADMHADTLLWHRNINKDNPYGHVDIPKLLKGNMGLQFFTVVTEVPMWVVTGNKKHTFDSVRWLAVSGSWPAKTWNSNFQRALYQAGKLEKFIENSQDIRLIKTKDDLAMYLAQRKNQPRQTAALLGIEGIHALDGRVENIKGLYDAGFRMISFAHFFDNEMSGSAHGDKKYGLTEKGIKAVARMNELGIIIDVSHVSKAGINDILKHSNSPVVSSHTGVKGTCANERNLSDEQLRAIAARGGIVGIAFFKWAICESSIEAVVKAIKYTVNLIGAEHVALGSDFDGAVHISFNVSEMGRLTQALVESGLSQDEIKLIMGENVKRLAMKVLK